MILYLTPRNSGNYVLAEPDTGKENAISCGWYCTEDGKTSSVAHWMDEERFKENGGVMNHETLTSLQGRTEPFTVDYAGFGWINSQRSL